MPRAPTSQDSLLVRLMAGVRCSQHADTAVDGRPGRLDLPRGQLPHRPPAGLAQEGASASRYSSHVRSGPGSLCLSQSRAACRPCRTGRAQPGVQLLALLLQGLDDVLLGPATDLVPPAPAIRAEAITQDAAGERQAEIPKFRHRSFQAGGQPARVQVGGRSCCPRVTVVSRLY